MGSARVPPANFSGSVSSTSVTKGEGEQFSPAAVKEDEAYYHRDQCDMITMILRLAAEPAWRYGRGRQTAPAADRNRRFGGCGTRVIDQACPWERVLYCYFSAPGVLCHFEKAHPSAHGVPYYRATQTKTKKRDPVRGAGAGAPRLGEIPRLPHGIHDDMGAGVDHAELSRM